MVRHVLSREEHGFDWYDMTNPTATDFTPFREEFHLHEISIKDCLEVGHLPRIEIFPHYHFVIIRSVADSFPENSDLLVEITDRISIFYSEKYVITVHRNPIKHLDKIIQTDRSDKRLKSSKALINHLISQSLRTFEEKVIHTFSEKLDEYEEYVFLHSRRKPFMKKLYYLKRQIDLIRIVLTLYKDIVDHFHMPEQLNAYSQNLKELYSRTSTLYRNIAENTSQLLSIYFNIESNHTNEIMRTLTIISVFFMPLTFLVGVYGMNFRYMPELDWKYGYPAVMLVMVLLSVAIYLWFKRRKWL